MHTTNYVDPVLMMMPNINDLINILISYKNKIKSYAYLIRNNFENISILYEEMVDRENNFLTEKTMKLIFNFLNVDLMDHVPNNPLKKMNPDKLRYFVLNYYEVIQVLRNSPFENLLDNPLWDKENVDLHRELCAGHLASKNDISSMLTHYYRAVSANEEDSEPYFYIALVYANIGQYKKSRKMFDNVFQCCNDLQRKHYYIHAYNLIKEKIPNFF